MAQQYQNNQYAPQGGQYPPAQGGGQYPPPVPGATQWMPAQQQLPGVPPGLEYLAGIDQLLAHQVVELLEAFTDWETNNRYVIKNTIGQQVFYAFEESGMCMRQCCGPNRGFDLHIVDNMNREVLKCKREFKCCATGLPCCACCDCCSHELAVEAPVGTVIGYVRQVCSAWVAHFDILNADRQRVLRIEGPCCICTGVWCFDQKFEIKTEDGSGVVGKIKKQHGGLVQEMFTDADNFGITFPVDMDVKIKAVLLAATFLIDFMFFENDKKNN